MMKFLLLLLLMFILFQLSFTQNVSSDTLDIHIIDSSFAFSRIRSLNHSRFLAEREAYLFKQKSKLLYIIPSVGLNSTFVFNKFRFGPSVNFSFSNLLRLREAAKKNKAIIRSLKSKYEIKLNSRLIAYNNLRSEYLSSLESLDYMTKVRDIKAKLYDLKRLEYENKKIDIEVYYRAQIAFYESERLLALKRYDVLKLKNKLKEILYVADYN